MSDCVQVFREGQTAWSNGVVGSLTRLRAIAGTVILTGLFMGAPWWWPQSNSISYKVPLSTALIVTVLFIGIGLFVGLLCLRSRTIRSLDIKRVLHDFVHYLRDNQSRIYNKTDTSNREQLGTELALVDGFCDYVDRICENIKDYFVKVIQDGAIDVAIRIAVEKKAEDGSIQVVYRTVGRSSGLSRDRAATSQDVDANRGIPRYLNEEHHCKGVLLYRDLAEAARVGAFLATKNEELYPHEIVTMLVAPINGWDGKKQSMIGLVYVTSRTQGVFKHKHVDCMRFVADMVAPSLAFTAQQLKSTGVVKELRRQQ